MFSVIIPQAYLAVPIRCFFCVADPAVRIFWGKCWCVECLEKLFAGKKKEKKPSAGSQGFFFCIGKQAGRNIGMLEYTFIHAGHRPRMQSDKILEWLLGFFGGKQKGKSLVQCYRTFSSRRNGAKTLSYIETYFSYASPNPRSSSQGHFFCSLGFYFHPSFLFQSLWMTSSQHFSLPSAI